MTDNAIKDITKKSIVVAKNEMTKYLRGKKILVIAGIMILALVGLTGVGIIVGDEILNDTKVFTSIYMVFASFIMGLIAVLFASTAIVSEFEERTALITFTKPIRRSSIFLGKFIATSLLGILFVIIYFVAVALLSFIVTGEILPELLTSMGLALLYMMGFTGVALLLSSVTKKGIIAILLAFVIILLVLPLITMLIAAALGGMDAVASDDFSSAWFMLDVAGSDIVNIFNENGDVKVFTSAAVMAAWCAVTTIASYLLFRRRDF